MSIIIKGMGMPWCCEECPMFDAFDDDYCRLISMQTPGGKRLNDCPLVEIPTPHGKLIDSDALADDLEWDANHFEDEHELKFNAASWLRSNQNKVILEAE